MARRFNSSLHPRDQNGKFRSKGGSSAKKSSGARKRRSFGQIRSNVYATKKRANTVQAQRPVKPLSSTRNKQSVAAEKFARNAQLALHGANVYSSSRNALAQGTAAATALSTPGGQALGAFLATKAAISTGQALNEAHRVRTLTSKNYVNGTVEEQSRFDTSYKKRAKVLNRANTATTVVGVLGTAGPLIKTLAGAQNNLRREQRERSDAASGEAYKAGGGTGALARRDGTNAKPKLIKPKRNGVYDITTVGSRRVA